ncbi:site-specific integrase [Aestuariivivens marinum]|uniref:site-specific integrase n=1 Tax=Aestuariivivens marinum TaxID=2913555 RepID=UPI001F57E90B|nr:site-specific integrase [Aestuariivivens marinum]
MKWEHTLKDYQLYLKIERGLSENSITNYVRDVKKLIHYLESHNINASPFTISHENTQNFIHV